VNYRGLYCPGSFAGGFLSPFKERREAPGGTIKWAQLPGVGPTARGGRSCRWPNAIHTSSQNTVG
ncbi:MAG: hypothetical protein VCD34_07395, partial [Planctomycetota bacterium]